MLPNLMDELLLFHASPRKFLDLSPKFNLQFLLNDLLFVDLKRETKFGERP
jgi:hypothetical protein